MTIPSEVTGAPRTRMDLRQLAGHYLTTLLMIAVALLAAAAYQSPRALRVNLTSAEGRGLTQGFYGNERNLGFDARWSSDKGEIALPSLAGGRYTLTIGAVAPRPDGSTARVALFLDRDPIGAITVGPAYERFSFSVAIPSGIVGNHTLALQTQAVKDPNNTTRMIGVAVVDVVLRATSWPMAPPLFPVLGLIADAILFYWLLTRWLRRYAFIAAVATVGTGMLFLLALRRPLGPTVYQLFIPLAFVYGVMACAAWALRRNRQPAWVLGTVSILAVAALSATDFLLRISQTGNPTDFLIFYRAATAVWTGHPQALYDLAAIRADPLLGVVFRQPPLAAFLIAPLAALSFPTALLVWRALLVGLIILSIGLLSRHLGLHRIGNPAGWPVIALVFFTLLWAPIRVSITSGQWDPILLLLLILALIALRRGQSPLAGFAIALAGIIKIYPLYLGLFLLWKREWRALGWLIASLVCFTAISGLTTGWGILRIYAQHVFPVIGGSTSFAQNQSLTALLLRLFGIEATTGLTITGLNLLCFVGVTIPLCLVLRLRTAREQGSYAVGYAATICAMLLVVPVAWDHYETVLLIPVAVLLAEGASSVSLSLSLTWLTVAAAALGLLTYGEARQVPSALTSEAFQYEDVTRALLSSYRVFAQLGLLFVLWHIARSDTPRAQIAHPADAPAEPAQMTEPVIEAPRRVPLS